jgi:hypothetical protein
MILYYFDYYALYVKYNWCCLLIDDYSGVCCDLPTRVDWLCALRVWLLRVTIALFCVRLGWDWEMQFFEFWRWPSLCEILSFDFVLCRVGDAAIMSLSWSTSSSGRYDSLLGFCDILTFADYCRPFQLSWWHRDAVVEVIVDSFCVRCGTVAWISSQFEWVAERVSGGIR